MRPVKVTNFEPHDVQFNVEELHRNMACVSLTFDDDYVTHWLRIENIDVVTVEQSRFAPEGLYVKLTCRIDDIMAKMLNSLHETVQQKLDHSMLTLSLKDTFTFFMTWREGRFMSMRDYPFCISRPCESRPSDIVDLKPDNLHFHLNKLVRFVFEPIILKYADKAEILFYVTHMAIDENTESRDLTVNTVANEPSLTTMHKLSFINKRIREKHDARLLFTLSFINSLQHDEVAEDNDPPPPYTE